MSRKGKAEKDSYVIQRRIKKENRDKILKILLRQPSTFSELVKQTGLSSMGLTKHLHELEELEQIGLIIYEKKRCYAVMTDKISVEDLIVEELMKDVGSLATYKILEASSKGEKEVRIEQFYNPQGFIKQFIEKSFMTVDIDYKTLFEAFRKRYGEPEI